MIKFKTDNITHIDINEGDIEMYYYLPERKGGIFTTYKSKGYYKYGEYERTMFSLEEIQKSEIYYLKNNVVLTKPYIKIYVGDCCIGTKYFKTREDMHSHIKENYSHLDTIL